MKKFILPLLALTLALGSCNMANDDDYKDLSKDLCDCVNTNAKDLSPAMRNAIIKSAEDGSAIDQVMTEAMMKDPTQGMKDSETLMKIATGMEPCVNSLEKKYKDIYTNDSEAEMQKKLLETMKAEKSCDFTYAMMKKGLEEQNKH